MATVTAKRPVTEMGNDEFQKLVKPTIDAAKETALNKGAWLSYRDDSCTEAGMFIHEFKDGHKELVKVGKGPGDYTVLKVF